MNDNRVLPDFWRIVLVKPVIIFREVALLRNPELNRIVLDPEKQEPKGAEESEGEWNGDNWHGLLTGHHAKPEIDNNGRFQNINEL